MKGLFVEERAWIPLVTAASEDVHVGCSGLHPSNHPTIMSRVSVRSRNSPGALWPSLCLGTHRCMDDQYRAWPIHTLGIYGMVIYT